MSAVLLNSTLAIEFGNQLSGEPRSPPPSPKKRKDVGTKKANLPRLSLESSLCSPSADLAELPSSRVSFRPSLDGDGKDQGTKAPRTIWMQSMFLMMSYCFFPECSFWKISFPQFFLFLFFKKNQFCTSLKATKIVWKYVGWSLPTEISKARGEAAESDSWWSRIRYLA